MRDLVPFRVAHGYGGASVHRKVDDDLAQVGDGGLDAGDFEEEALAVAGALVEPHHGGHGGGYSGHGIGMGAVAGGVGRRVRVVAQPGVAGESVHGPAHGDAVPVRAGDPEPGDAGVHQVGAHLPQLLVADAEFLGDTGHHVGVHHVADFDETIEGVEAARVAEVNGGAALVAVGADEGRVDVVGALGGPLAGVAIEPGRGHDRPAGMVHALDRLDLNDFRAKKAEYLGGEGPRPAFRQFEDAKTREWRSVHSPAPRPLGPRGHCTQRQDSERTVPESAYRV